MRKLFYALPFCFVVQAAFAEYDPGAYIEIEADPEPNWETAAYSCPESVVTAKGNLPLSSFGMYDVENDALYELVPEHRKYVYYRQLQNYNIQLLCQYGQKLEMLIRAKDTVACGGNGTPGHLVCWTTDPYAGKK
ncbi:MAG: hypothetical protein LBG78_07205 [Azoarcus sp.]|nr:hypothetical protein [Azoarcus sp.]